MIQGCTFERYTESTITDRAALEEELKKVRKNGFAINDQEMEIGVRSVAAPVFGENAVPVGAINISVPSVRLSRKILEEEVAPVLMKYALEISLSKPHQSEA